MDIMIVPFFYLIFFSAELSKQKNCFLINPNTNFDDLNISNLTNNDIEFILFNTTYSNQITIDISSSLFRSYSSLQYSFRSLNNNNPEFIYFKTSHYNQYNLHFRSIFVTFSSIDFFIQNLTLFESPISSINKKINLTVDYFKSDFLSIPKVNVSSIYINKEYVFSDDQEHTEKSTQKHATIILSPNAKQKFTKGHAKESYNSFPHFEYFYSHDNLRSLIEKVQTLPDNQIKSEKVHLLNDESNSQEGDGELDESVPSFTPIPTPTEAPDDFDDNETNSTAVIDFYFNSSLSELEIYNNKVTAIYENQQSEVVEANLTGHLNVYTNSKSLTLKYLDEANFINSLKLNIILLTESIIIFDQSWRIFGDTVISSITIIHNENDLLTLMTDLDEVPYATIVPMVNVRYVPDRLQTESYCLCTNNRLEQCIENRDCFLYSIPIDHYYSSSNSIISDIVANSKAETINLYLASLSSLNDYHQFLIRSFFRGRKTLNFISVNPEESVNLVLFDLSRKRDPNKLIVNCVDVSDLMMSLNYDTTIDTLILKNSPIRLIKTLSIRNLETDCYSLNRRQSNTINIIESLTINRAESNTIGINFMLKNDASIYIQQISVFPSISLAQSQISFAGNECEFSVSFEGNCIVKVSERTNCNPTITLTSDVPFNTELKMEIDFILENSLIIDFTNSLPFPNGLSINFIPNDEILTSLELIMMDSSSFDYPSSSFSSSEASSFRLFPFGNITGNIDLILASSETVRTFLTSLHNNDFAVSNLSQISMNFNDNLIAVIFYDESIVAKTIDETSYSMELRFDRLFITGQMTIITNTSNTISLALNYSEFLNLTDFNDVIPGLTSKMQDFVLKSTNEKSSVFFDETFGPFVNNSVISKIKIDHGTNNVELKTNLTTVPNIEVMDDVAGVLYYANLTTINLTHSFNDTEICYDCDVASHSSNNGTNNTIGMYQYNLSNYRSGPNMTIYIEESDIFVNQNQFLSENVTFIGESFTFITKTKSRCNYNFVDIRSLSIVPTERSINESIESDEILNTTDIFNSSTQTFKSRDIDFNVYKNSPSYFTFLDEIINTNHELLKLNYSLFKSFFRAKYLTLKNTPIKVVGNNVLLLFNYLKSDILSLSTFDSSSSTIAANILTLVDDENMKQVVIDSNSLAASCDLLSAQSSEEEAENLDSDSSLVTQSNREKYFTPFINSSLFIIHYSSPDKFYVSLSSKTISSKFFFVMESTTSVHIYLDNSWYQAVNADLVTFVIVNAKSNRNKKGQNNDLYMESSFNVTIETALYELPNIRVVDSSLENTSYRVILYDPVFDANMSFYIFISLAAAVAIVSIVFLFISIFCFEKFEIEDEKTAIDVSSGNRRAKSKMKIAKTSNNSSDSSEEPDVISLNTEKSVNKENEKMESVNKFVVDDSSEADDERSDMSFNIHVDD